MSMSAHERPRVLVAAVAEQSGHLHALFAQEPLAGWEMQAANSFAQARFTLQHQPCDLLMATSELLEREGGQGLAWLAFQREAPILFLGDDQATLYAQAYDLGAAMCLPWTLALGHPPLLHAVMQHAMTDWEAKIVQERTRSQLSDSRRQVDRLVQMIWRLTPRHDDHWYSQRHMLERLHEELARCQRYQLPLSIAVGELEQPAEDAAPRLPDWAAESIVRGKRRCDVVGQYGPDGFLLLMVQTPKPGGVTCCRRLQDYLEHPTQDLNAPHLPVRSFFGIASMNGEQNTPQGLLRLAEQNLEMARGQEQTRIVAE